MATPITPVTVIGGYLGAGKTTLINACLKTRGERRIAVLVNDFGDINIDASLIESRSDTLINLAGGCVCCTIGSDFLEALFELAALPQPFDHVLVETSGVALPRPLAQSVNLSQSFSVQSVLVLVDGTTIAGKLDDVYVGDTVRQQITQADWVLVTKVADLATRGAALQSFGKPLLCLPRSEYDCDWLLGSSAEYRVGRGGGPAQWLTQPAGKFRVQTAAQASQIFESLSIELEVPVPLAALLPALQKLASGAPPVLIRAKGLVRDQACPGQLQLLQMVGAQVEVSPYEGEGAMALVLIGIRSAMEDNAQALNELIALLQSAQG